MLAQTEIQIRKGSARKQSKTKTMTMRSLKLLLVLMSSSSLRAKAHMIIREASVSKAIGREHIINVKVTSWSLSELLQ